MCNAPIYISNTYFHSKSKVIQMLHNTEVSRIPVPCGRCAACRSRKQTDLLQRVQLESLRSYVYFFTLTYNSDSVPIDILPDGTEIKVARYDHLQKMMKRVRLRKYFGDRTIKHLISAERSPVKGRIHYHGLLFVAKHPDDDLYTQFNLEHIGFDAIKKEWCQNLGSDKVPIYVPLFTYIRKFYGGKLHTTYDFHLVKPTLNGSNDVSFYCTKYLFKQSSYEKFILKKLYECYGYTYDELGNRVSNVPKIYNRVYKPHSIKSLNLGGFWTHDSYNDYRKSHSDLSLTYDPIITELVYKNVVKSKVNDSPLQFFDIYTGKGMPLSKYYIKQFDLSTQVYHVKSCLKKSNTIVPDVLDIFRKRDSEIIKSRVFDRSQLVDEFDNDLLFNT